MTHPTGNDEPTNIQRAEWAKAALTVFTEETCGGEHPDSMIRGDLEDAISDLICDLLHFAHLHPRMTPAEIHARALRNFEQEIADERVCDCADLEWYGPYHDTQCPAVPRTPASDAQAGISRMPGMGCGAMATFHVGIGIGRASITLDNRFTVEISRNAPPPMVSAQLVLKVYPITDGEAWDEPYEVFAVDEGRVVELELQMKE